MFKTLLPVNWDRVQLGAVLGIGLMPIGYLIADIVVSAWLFPSPNFSWSPEVLLGSVLGAVFWGYLFVGLVVLLLGLPAYWMLVKLGIAGYIPVLFLGVVGGYYFPIVAGLTNNPGNEILFSIVGAFVASVGWVVANYINLTRAFTLTRRRDAAPRK